MHPRSGAGSIKADASTDQELLEYKDANKTHTLNGEELLLLFKRGAQQGKDARYIIKFANNIIAEIHLTRE